MSALAKLVLEFDRRWPGDADAPMELPAKEWSRLVDLARAEQGKPKKRETAYRPGAVSDRPEITP